MKVVHGIDSLDSSIGRIFVVVGVFDGLHLGHLYLLDELRRAAADHGAKPVVITFDHHPDEILTGAAPPLLCDPQERLLRLAAAGVEATVVATFDVALRMTPYDAFVRAIAERVDLAGFVMTPESAFGHDRLGTPETVAALGRDVGFAVEVVPPLLVDGRPVSSGEIRRAIAEGQLAVAERLLGRPYAVTGTVADGGSVQFAMPVALPPLGTYSVLLTPAEGRGSPTGDGWLDLEPDGSVHVHDSALRVGSVDRLRIVFRDSSVA
ncbi:MAG TPA: FAD synthetase family protein [Candidatus Limnocylindrales bacterium]|nr:FAD synthetase family protein [Candidatus Limnocylindrales bacterium]